MSFSVAKYGDLVVKKLEVNRLAILISLTYNNNKENIYF